jgi:hypothetical protein
MLNTLLDCLPPFTYRNFQLQWPKINCWKRIIQFWFWVRSRFKSRPKKKLKIFLLCWALNHGSSRKKQCIWQSCYTVLVYMLKAGLHIGQYCWQYCSRLFCLLFMRKNWVWKCASLEQHCQLYCPSKSLCKPALHYMSLSHSWNWNVVESW